MIQKRDEVHQISSLLFVYFSALFTRVHACVRISDSETQPRQNEKETQHGFDGFSSFFFFILFLQFSGNKLEENWMLLSDVQSDLTSVQSHLRKS